MTRLCQRCGKPVHVGFKFCNVCGEPVNDDGASAGDVVSYSPLLGIRGRTLRVLTGDHAGQFYDAFPAVTVGRNNADIVSADPTVSPVHARLDATESGAQIQDMDSLNGVFVRTKDEKTLLHDNDIIRAGDHLFLFEVIALDRYSEESAPNSMPLRYAAKTSDSSKYSQAACAAAHVSPPTDASPSDDQKATSSSPTTKK